MARLKKNECLAAIHDNKGNVSKAADQLSVDRNTLYAYIERYELQDALDEARATRLDWVESQLDKRIEKGDTTAIIFFLKTQGKARGYVERQEIAGVRDAPIVVQWPEDDGN